VCDVTDLGDQWQVGVVTFLRTVVAVVFGHFEFSFEYSETRFHEGTVVTVGRAAHALMNVRSTQNGAILRSRILASAIGVINQAVS